MASDELDIAEILQHVLQHRDNIYPGLLTACYSGIKQFIQDNERMAGATAANIRYHVGSCASYETLQRLLDGGLRWDHRGNSYPEFDLNSAQQLTTQLRMHLTKSIYRAGFTKGWLLKQIAANRSASPDRAYLV